MSFIKVSSQYSWHFVDFSWHNMSSSPVHLVRHTQMMMMMMRRRRMVKMMMVVTVILKMMMMLV